ncbi:MAG: YNFM family putative membrane transporter [Gammaproteobacteria bacterium]|jgi:YNFM family putative membrane transporter
MTRLRYSLLLLASGGFVSGLSMRMAEPLLPRIAEDFNSTVAEASILITSFSLAYGLFQLLHGPLGDRIGKLRTVSGAMALAALACAACAGADSLASLGWFRFFTGMTAGAVIPLSYAFVGDNIPWPERQPVLGRFIAGTLLGFTCGPLLGGVFSDYWGWRTAYMVPSAAFAVISIALIPLARSEVSGGSASRLNPLTSYLSLLRLKGARLICLIVAVEGILFFGAFAYIGAWLRDEFALSFTNIGLLLAGFGAGSVLYSLAVGTIVRRFGAQRMVRAGGALLLVAFVCLAATPNWYLAVPAIMLLGLAFYLLHNTLQTMATEMSPSARGSAVSAFAFCLFCGQAIGVSGAGLLAEWLGYRTVFTLAGLGLALLATAFARRLHALQ